MVRRTVIILVITACLITVAIMEQFYITGALNQLHNKAEILQSSVEESGDTINTAYNLSLMEDLATSWEESEKIICLTVNHNELEVISQEIVRLKSKIEENDTEYIAEYFETIKHFADKHKHTMSFTIQNIF